MRKTRSVDCSLIITAVFATALILLTFTGPFTVRFLCEQFHRERLTEFLIAVTYAAIPAGWCAIYCLFKLLLNIRKNIVFDTCNVRLLNFLSLLCIYVGILSAFATVKFAVFAIISLSALFVGLIVRVVRAIISTAIEIKEENDMTI